MALRNMLVILCVAYSSFLVGHSLAADTLGEPVKEFSVTEHPIFNANTHSSRMMTTEDGTIYFCYVNEKLEGVVLKKDKDGTITETVVIPKHQEDTHNHISIGIDEKGYIHVAGDMHHAPLIGKRPKNRDHLHVPWQYWISKKPHDISAFEFVGNTKQAPSGTRLTYPYFFRDREGKLYLVYRAGVIGKGYVYGVMGGCLAQYDTRKKRWKDVGGKTSYGMNALLWTEQGVTDPTSGPKVTGYQSYKIFPYVDADNNIHLTWTTFGKKSPRVGGFGAQYLLHAMSKDGGKTWCKADGSKIKSLPITEENGDVVHESVGGTRGLASVSRMCVDGNGQPLVAMRENGVPKWSVFDKKKGWSAPEKSISYVVIGDDNGTVTIQRKGQLMRTRDAGASWSNYAVKELTGGTFPHDFEYTADTGDLRLVTKEGNTLTVWTIPTRSYTNKQRNLR